MVILLVASPTGITLVREVPGLGTHYGRKKGFLLSVISMWPARRQRDIVWAPSGACEQTINGLKVKMGIAGESSKICHQRMMASAIGSRH